ncbi:MAG: UDP-N-acetylglucosamine--N-acetylmuramyl-(pentapeptide) pyrophosphoryl-undecaprenol N-acetylglucosamine transferase [Phycisphaerales bacterium JB064]
MTDRSPLGIAFLGGGSGGHIYPSLAVADAISHLEPRAKAVFLTGDRAADELALQDQTPFGQPAKRVALHARPPSVRPRAMVACLRNWGGAVRDSRTVLRELRSTCDRVVAMSTGGYVSAPAAQAARVERVPLVLVSLDARIGKANRFVAKRAQHRLVAQNEAPAGWKPIGPIVGQRALPPGDKPHCRHLLGLDPSLPTLLVMGGSQGATSINRLMCEFARKSPGLLDGWQVIHLAGDARATADVQHAYDDAGIAAFVSPLLSPIGPAWGSADLAICRSGAGTVAEAHASGVPCVFLPYPYHKDQHQAANAQPLANAGGAIIVQDAIEPGANLERLSPTLSELLPTPTKRATMVQALSNLPRQDGASACARVLLDTAIRI